MFGLADKQAEPTKTLSAVPKDTDPEIAAPAKNLVEQSVLMARTDTCEKPGKRDQAERLADRVLREYARLGTIGSFRMRSGLRWHHKCRGLRGLWTDPLRHGRRGTT